MLRECGLSQSCFGACSASAVDRCQIGPAQAGSTAVNSENCLSVFNFSICGLEILSVSAGFYLGLPCWKIKVITSKAGHRFFFFFWHSYTPQLLRSKCPIVVHLKCIHTNVLFFLHLLLTCKILQAKSSHFNTNFTWSTWWNFTIGEELWHANSEHQPIASDLCVSEDSWLGNKAKLSVYSASFI